MFRSTRCKEGGSAECGDFCMVFSEQMGATEILVCGLFLRPAFRNKLRYWTGRRNETFSQSCYAQAFPRIGGIRQSRQPFQYKPAYLWPSMQPERETVASKEVLMTFLWHTPCRPIRLHYPKSLSVFVEAGRVPIFRKPQQTKTNLYSDSSAT